MKKTFLAFLFVSLVSVGMASAGSIGENFEAAGLSFSAGGHYYNTFDGYSSYSVHGGVDFYVVNNLAFGVGVSYRGNTYDAGKLSVNGDINFAIVPNPRASTGFVFLSGMDLGYTWDFEDSYGYGYLTPWIRANFFVAPRIAPFIRLEAISVYFDDNSYTDLIGTYFYVGFGISFYKPTKDVVLTR